MKAVYIEEHGGPDKILVGERPTPHAGAGEVLVKVAASGVNFIDTYHRTGLYKVALPFIFGGEGAGTVEALGEGVTAFAPGDRVVWAMHLGSYAEYAAVPVTRVVKLPADIDFVNAAAALLQGMTAHYLTHSTFPLKKGDTALIHAAAGGTGLLLVQMAKKLGARVIGTAGNEAKAALARGAGADEVILYAHEDFAAAVKRLTGGRGVDVVYDSVGKSTFEGSLNSLRPRGYMVTFGNASGPVPDVAPLTLTQKGSLFLTRPTLANYIAPGDELNWRAGDVLRWMSEGSLKVRIHKVYPLAEAARAQHDLESRGTTGKLVLKVA
ncbi:MAG TPA: quinone oxidoreductase [Bryobacteraceae bacterium]|nr:quinone oxidoreductase [Bryobacteraceae bacterium]